MSLRSWSADPISRLCAITLALAVGVGATGALAQDDDGEQLLSSSSGPKNLALIIGNSDYNHDGATEPFNNPPPGFLTDLRVSCNDAKLIYDRLVASGWPTDTGQEASATTLRCNLTPAQMATEIQNFWVKIDKARGARIVFYFSGHGAEINGHKYLFGVGAPIDLASAADRLRISKTDDSFFKASGFDLRDLLVKIGEQTDNAVLIVIDSCRNDPLYAKLDSMSGVKLLAPSATADERDGVIVTYATRQGAFAFTPPKRRYSLYSAELASHIQKGPKFGDVVDYANSQTSDLTRKWEQPQKPIRYGSLHQPPPWCIGECSQKDPVPEPIPDAEDTAADALPERAPPPAQAPETTSSLRVTRTFDRVPIAIRYWVQPASLFSGEPIQDGEATAAQSPGSTAKIPSLAPARRPKVIYDSPSAFSQSPQSESAVQPAPLDPIQVDIYWCGGADTGSEILGAQAENLAVELGNYATGSEAATSQKIMGIRTRFLSSEANSRPTFRYTDNVVIYDAGDRAEVELARRMARLSPGLKPRAAVTRTPRSVTAYYCKAPISPTPTIRIYFQTPTKEQKPATKLLRNQALSLLGDQAEKREVDVEKDASPDDTLIKYFHLEDRDLTFRLADILGQRLGHVVAVSFQGATYGSKVKVGHVEVWIGKKESLPTISQKAAAAITQGRS
ncbi:caspase family protein [Caulobacter sp. LARHSG274]